MSSFFRLPVCQEDFLVQYSAHNNILTNDEIVVDRCLVAA